MKEHYLKHKDGSNYFYIMILFFSVYCFFFITSGAYIFYVKTGFTVSGVYEYYMGSEKAITVFPDIEDRFMNPKTLPGLLKSILPHFLVYGIVIFTLIHFFNSLSSKSILLRMKWMNRLIFPFAMLEILSGVFVLYGPFWMIYFRMIVFAIFVFLFLILIFAAISATTVNRFFNSSLN